MPEDKDRPPVVLLPDIPARGFIRRSFDRLDALPPSSIIVAGFFVILFLANAAFGYLSQDDPGRYWPLYALLNICYLILVSFFVSGILILFSDRVTFWPIFRSVIAKFFIVASMFFVIGWIIAWAFLILLFTLAGPNIG